VKVLDFGISKISLHDLSTRTGDIMGSPAYMAPEQMESTRNVDQRADVWSLGVVLYQLVTGKPPFQGETLPLLCMHVVNDDPAPISAIRGDLPPGLEAAAMKCLRKNPAERYRDVGELAHAIAPFGPKHASTSASRIQIVLRRATGSETAVSDSADLVTQPVRTDGPPGVTADRSRERDRGKRRSWGVIGAVLAGLAIGGAVVGMLWRSGWVGDARFSEPAVVVVPPEPATAPAAEAARPPRPIVEPITEESPRLPPVAAEPGAVDPSGAPAAGPPSAIASQPSSAGAPSAIASQPSSAGAPSAIASQPSSGGAQPAAAAGQPSSAAEQPASVVSPATPAKHAAPASPDRKRRKPRGRVAAPHATGGSAAGAAAGSAQDDDDDK